MNVLRDLPRGCCLVRYRVCLKPFFYRQTGMSVLRKLVEAQGLEPWTR